MLVTVSLFCQGNTKTVRATGELEQLLKTSGLVRLDIPEENVKYPIRYQKFMGDTEIRLVTPKYIEHTEFDTTSDLKAVYQLLGVFKENQWININHPELFMNLERKWVMELSGPLEVFEVGYYNAKSKEGGWMFMPVSDPLAACAACYLKFKQELGLPLIVEEADQLQFLTAISDYEHVNLTDQY